MVADAVGRVALLQEPRSIAIQRRTDDGQRCIATVKLGIQIKQHRMLSFPGAALPRGPTTPTNPTMSFPLGTPCPQGFIAAGQLMKLERYCCFWVRPFPPQRPQNGGKRSEKAIESCVTYTDTFSQSFARERVTSISRLV